VTSQLKNKKVLIEGFRSFPESRDAALLMFVTCYRILCLLVSQLIKSR
jgi:hypothetical protein